MELLTPETSLGYAAAFISNSSFPLSSDENVSSSIFLVFFSCWLIYGLFFLSVLIRLVLLALFIDRFRGFRSFKKLV